MAPAQVVQDDTKPSELPNVPTGQLMQSSAESWEEAEGSSVVILPAGHEVQSDSSADLNEPKGQTEHE